MISPVFGTNMNSIIFDTLRDRKFSVGLASFSNTPTVDWSLVPDSYEDIQILSLLKILYTTFEFTVWNYFKVFFASIDTSHLLFFVQQMGNPMRNRFFSINSWSKMLLIRVIEIFKICWILRYVTFWFFIIKLCTPSTFFSTSIVLVGPLRNASLILSRPC